MTEYRIQELFDFQECKKYFIIQANYNGRDWVIKDVPRLYCLEDAKTIVRIMKEYEQPVYHYVDTEEN